MPFASGANVTSDHAIFRENSSLCPASNTIFNTGFDYNDFFIESNLEVYVTTCQMAVLDKAKLEENGYTVYGLPEESKCFWEDEA